MPFTITHTAAILPIARFAPKLPVSALAIGSMLPDAPIFFSLGYGYSFLHSLPGLLLATVPLGLIAYTLFHLFIKEAVVSIAPDFVSRRLTGMLGKQDPVPIIYICIALILGASTHIVWDLFTHSGRWGVELIPQLQASYTFGKYTVSGHEIAQHGSSLVCLPLLALFLAIRISELPAKSLPQPAPVLRKATQFWIIASPLLSSLIVWTLRSSRPMSFLFEATVLSGILILLSIAAYTIAYQLRTGNLRIEAIKRK